MHDPDLFSGGNIYDMKAPTPVARVTDPATSHAAAASMREGATAQRDRILALLSERGLNALGIIGATANEIDRAFGWRDGTAGRRLSEMDKVLGWAEPLLRLSSRKGITRPTESGRPAQVYVITPAGRAVHRRSVEGAAG